MAVYRIWPATSGAADTGDYTTTDLGLQFHVTTTTCTLTGYYWWLPATDDTTGTNYSFRLYSTTNGTTGTPRCRRVAPAHPGAIDGGQPAHDRPAFPSRIGRFVGRRARVPGTVARSGDADL